MADAGTASTDDDGLLAALRARLAATPGAAALDGAKLDALLAELVPFCEVARRAEDDPEDGAALWREARSLAWLFAYRLGDQGHAAFAAASVVVAWREARGTAWARRAADELAALVLDAYARGREDRTRQDAQRALAESLPVAEVAPGLVLVVAAGPLDPDAAERLADRASSLLLRADARAVLLDVSGLAAPTDAVLSALWAVPAAARALGAKMVVSGVTDALGALPPAGGEQRAPTLAAGVEVLLREAGMTLGASGLVAWAKRVLGRAR